MQVLDSTPWNVLQASARNEGLKMSEQDSNWKPIGKLAEELARKLAEKREAEGK